MTADGGVVPQRLEAAASFGPFLEVGDGQAMLRLPGLGRLLATADGVAVAPDAGHVIEDLAPLHASALACSWMFRGALPLRAATVERDGRAMLLVGLAATGKSTVAAALVGSGWRLIGDAVAPVRAGDDGVVVEPTSDSVDLWPEALEQLGHPGDLGRTIRPGVAKRSVTATELGGTALDGTGAGGTVPVAAVVLLRSRDRDERVVDRVSGFDAVNLVTGSVWNARACASVLGPTAHFESCMRIVRSATVARVGACHGEHPSTTAATVAEFVDRAPRPDRGTR